MIFNPLNYTTVFLSYDEPNCEDNYKHLLTLCPSAKRVHGVQGSDNAHKEVAKLSETENVIVVDGDNKVKSYFYNTTIELAQNVDISTSVLSFSGYNTVNGNCYGNGGIKVWPTKLLQDMRTHENGDKNSVDFNLSNYLELNMIGSDVEINGSPFQAWKAGLRESVKLSLDKNMDWRNYDRLWRWMHVGNDVVNGIWAIYGARFGYYQMMLGWDYSCIKNTPYLKYKFEQICDLYRNYIGAETNRLGNLLRIGRNDRNIESFLTMDQSRAYKKNIPCILRSPETFLANPPKTEYDIVFISYNEEYATENYNNLLKKFPRAKRINGIKGIHQAHIEAAKLCSTDYFWVVDADAEIVDDFNFDFVAPFYEQPTVRVWRSKNAVNDLIYGNGGVKLLPRMNVLRMRSDKPDMTTSISELYEPVMVVSNINKFNSDPYSTWRSAFRECVKLSSQVIDRQNNEETIQRLDTWCNVGHEKRYGKYSIDGANAGREYGKRYYKDIDMLMKINDYDWLKERYDEFYRNTVQ